MTDLDDMERPARYRTVVVREHADRVVVEDYLLAIDQVDARLGKLDAELAAVATTEP